jgi:hypothetical protein
MTNSLNSWYLFGCIRNSLFVCNPKVHYLVHKSPPLDPILSHRHSGHVTSSLRCVLILSFDLHPSLPSSLLTFTHKNFVLFSSFFLYATRPAYVIFTDLTPQNIHHIVTSYFLRPNILLSIFSSNSLNLPSSLHVRK